MKCIYLFLSGVIIFSVVANPARAENVFIDSKALHEECFNVLKGQEVSFIFSASNIVHFNAHYHDGEESIDIADEKWVTDREGFFNANLDQSYCMMWVNNGLEKVSLEYQYSIKDGEKDVSEMETPSAAKPPPQIGANEDNLKKSDSDEQKGMQGHKADDKVSQEAVKLKDQEREKSALAPEEE